MQQGGDIALLDPGDLRLLHRQVTDEHRFQRCQPLGGGDHETDRIRRLLLVRLAPLPDDQSADSGRVHLVQERSEFLFPGAVLVLVRLDEDAPGRGVGGRPGTVLRPGLEIDGRKAEQLVQVVHTGHGPELLMTATV